MLPEKVLLLLSAEQLLGSFLRWAISRIPGSAFDFLFLEEID